jgi:hypothetical protein
MKSIYSIIACLLTFSACNVDNRVENAGQLANEVKANQVKRVTGSQINETVQNWGAQIVAASQKALLKQLTDNNVNRDSLCQNVGAIPLIKTIEEEYQVEIDLFNEAKATSTPFTGKEKELVDAYLATASQVNTSNSENIQQLSDSTYLYTVWLATQDEVCQTCFGKDTHPFALWKVEFNKKAIIKKLNTVK